MPTQNQQPFPQGHRPRRANSAYAVPDDALAADLETLVHPQDLPLFVAKPQMLDVRQGASGQCFIDAALLSIIYTNPYFLSTILNKQGNTIMLSLYRRDSEGVLKSFRLVIEDSDFKPQAIAALHAHAPWASNLVKAYAIVRAKFYEEPSPSGKLDLLKHMSEGGQPSDVFEMLTGEFSETLAIGQDEQKNEFFIAQENNKAAIAKFATIWQSALRNSNIEKSSPKKAISAVKKASAVRKPKGTRKATAIFKIILAQIQSSDIDEENKELFLTELRNSKEKSIEMIRKYLSSRQEDQELALIELVSFSSGIPLAENSLIPEFMQKLPNLMKQALNKKYNLDFDNISLQAFTPEKTPKASRGNYSPEIRFIFEKIEAQIKAGNYLTASTEKFDSQNQAADHAGESLHLGLAGGHAYAVLGTCKRTDKDGQERFFIRLKNPWQHYGAEYNSRGLRQASDDQKGPATREYEQRKLFGSKKHSSSDFLDPQIPSLNAAANGLFELELSDFCQHFLTITMAPNSQALTKLLHNLQTLIDTSLHYSENEAFRQALGEILELFNGDETSWDNPEHLLLALCNKLKALNVSSDSLNINEKTFVDFCHALKTAGEDSKYTKAIQIVQEYALKTQEIYGYSEKQLLKKIQDTQVILSIPATHLANTEISDTYKIIRIYYCLAAKMSKINSHEEREMAHQLLFDIRQHWKSQIHQYRDSPGEKDKKDLYNCLDEIAFDEAVKLEAGKSAWSMPAIQGHYGNRVTGQIKAQASAVLASRLSKLTSGLFARTKPGPTISSSIPQQGAR